MFTLQGMRGNVELITEKLDKRQSRKFWRNSKRQTGNIIIQAKISRQ